MRVVVDTNIVFEGLTRQGSAAGFVIEAWLTGLLDICVSNALAYEYTDVLTRKLSGQRWKAIKPVLGSLLAQSRFVTVYYTWRPVSPDPGDDHVIDCAMNAGALIVTSNLKDFRLAQDALGISVIPPVELVNRLATS